MIKSSRKGSLSLKSRRQWMRDNQWGKRSPHCFFEEAYGEFYCSEISLDCQADLLGSLWPVLGCWGCPNEAPQAGWLDQEKSTFSQSGDGCPRSRCCWGWFAVRPLFPACRRSCFHCPHIAFLPLCLCRESELSGVCLFLFL